MRAGTGFARALFQELTDIVARGWKGRQRAEKYSGEDGNSQAEEKNGCVQMDFIHARDMRGAEQLESEKPPTGEEQAECTAEEVLRC